MWFSIVLGVFFFFLLACIFSWIFVRNNRYNIVLTIITIILLVKILLIVILSLSLYGNKNQLKDSQNKIIHKEDKPKVEKNPKSEIVSKKSSENETYPGDKDDCIAPTGGPSPFYIPQILRGKMF